MRSIQTTALRRIVTLFVKRQVVFVIFMALALVIMVISAGGTSAGMRFP